ncbi:hypothetical protein R1flu_002724 [Riccia fluitans]|uniref:Uncharacterized protein n=1 Tax=Riccia fluitans TaxID=41844 RepID=A0ABD1YAR2_9MARC
MREVPSLPIPYSNSSFFIVRKIEDPTGLLPNEIKLGINERGVHFFRRVPSEYFHFAKLHDVMEFGSDDRVVRLKIRITGVLHQFLLETKQGEDICIALQTHINNALAGLFWRTGSVADESLPNGSKCENMIQS